MKILKSQYKTKLALCAGAAALAALAPQAHAQSSDALIDKLEAKGILTADEAKSLHTKHVLSRSLGANLFVKVDVTEVQVQPGDALLLCSDGLHGAVSDSEIAHTVSRGQDLKDVAAALVASANQQDGSDNVSIQLIAVRSVERTGMYRGRPYKLH